MCHHRSSITLYPLLFATVCLLPGIARGQSPSALVPAQFTPFHTMTDSQGFLWDIDQWGRVMNGTDSCFSQSFTLLINNSQWRPNRSMMTADGSELVLQGAAMQPGLEITRRIHVDPKATGARFAEVFTNSSAAPVSLQVRSVLNAGNGQWQATVSDSGQLNPNVLGKQETGIVLFGMPQTGQVSVALYLAGQNAPVRPSIQPAMNGQPGFAYALTVPPRKTVAIIYGVAQCRLNNQPDGKAVADLLKPFSGTSWVQDLPAEIRRAAVNFGGFGGDVHWEEVGIGKLLASLETNTGPTDVLAFAGGTRLKGAATCSSFALETRFGTLKSSLDKIVAVAGARDHSGKAVVVFRDGQVLAGKLHVENFVFTLNSGLQIEAPAERLERLYMRASPGAAAAVADKAVLLQTSEGERLALAATGKENLALISPWGRFEFPLDDVVRVSAVAEPPGHRVVLRDGTRLFGYLEASPLKLPTRSFGALSLSPLEMQEIHGLQDKETADDPSRLALPCVVLAGENVLTGRVDLPALHIVTSGQTIAVPPGQIRKLRASDAGANGEEAAFEADLWDGGKVVGKLAEAVLPIRCGDGSRVVPAHDVVEIHVPSPSISESTRNKIAGLIRDLGASEYAKRKAASAALLELGPLARPQLTEILQQTSDPEVRRAAQSILDEVNK